MGKRQRDKLSVFISLILRHKPEEVGLTLDTFGYVSVEDLLNGINASGRTIDLATLRQIVAEDEKRRYSFNKEGSRIRANQGHSIPVQIPLTETEPPRYLYHGTSKASLQAILTEGIQRMARQYVHLSNNTETALQVGKRHGKPVILQVAAQQMQKDGHLFYLSKNGVWQVHYVPPTYVSVWVVEQVEEMGGPGYVSK